VLAVWCFDGVRWCIGVWRVVVCVCGVRVVVCVCGVLCGGVLCVLCVCVCVLGVAYARRCRLLLIE
jgi:hypothetical protein